MDADVSDDVLSPRPGALSRRSALRLAGGAGLAAAALAAGSRSARAAAEENAALARQIVDALNTGNLDALDAIVTPDFVGHNGSLPLPGKGLGLAGVKKNFQAIRTGFPDVRVAIDDLIVGGDKVVARVTLRGTHTGNFLGLPPTGRPITISGTNIARIVNGKVAENWNDVDGLTALFQLGILSLPDILRAGVAAATPAAASSLDALLTVPGVVFAVEFSADGKLVDYRSHLELPQDQVARAAAYGSTVSALARTIADGYTSLSGQRWDPPRWALFSGGEWTAAVAGTRGVLAQTAQVRFDDLYAALVGTR